MAVEAIPSGDSGAPGKEEALVKRDASLKVEVQLRKPDDRAAQWDTKAPLLESPDTLCLSGSKQNEWHSELITTEPWFELPASKKPLPVVHLNNESGELRGIIHLRERDEHREACISLVAPDGTWQTGVWLEINPGDNLAVSWFNDWSGDEVSAINLEIVHQHQPIGQDMDALRLAESSHEEWHSETIDTEPWFRAQVDQSPTPVIQLTNEHGDLRGIIHLRGDRDRRECCLSLVSRKDIWQTGIWQQIKPEDEVAISWCTDWLGNELSAINLEIIRHEPD